MPSFNFFIMGLLDTILGAGGDFLSYTPWSWVDSAVESGLDSLGLSQHGRDQYFQRSLQREMLEKQQAFQREMFGLSTDFAREQTSNQQWFTKQMYQQQLQDMLKNYPELMRMQSDAQFNLWKNQFQMQNNYNSPGTQTARLLAAGINPSSVFGGSGSVAVSQMSPSSVGGQPPLISPTPFNSHMFGANGSPVGLPSGYVGNMRDNLSSIGSFIRDVAQAKKSNKESNRYDEITDAMIEKLYQEGQSHEALAAYNGAKAVIERALGKEYKKSQIDVNLRLAMVYGQQEKTEKALEQLHQAETWLTNSKNEEILERLPFIQDNLNAIRDYLESGAVRNRAEAGLSYAKTLTESDLRNMYKQQGGLYEEVKGLRHVDRVEQYATMPDRIMRSINEAEQSGLISQQMAEDLRTAQKNNDWYDVREGMNIMYNGLNQYYHGRFVSGYETKNSIDEKWNDYMIDHYGDTNEEYEETYMNNRGHKVRQRFSRKRAPK